MTIYKEIKVSELEDQQALRDLMATYIDAVARDDGETWKNTWDENGCWMLMGNEVRGREAIAGLWQQLMAGFDFALLVPSTCRYDIEGDRARGFWYLQEFTRTTDGQASQLFSRYTDECIRTAEGWRYLSRGYDIIYQGPVDMSGELHRLQS